MANVKTVQVRVTDIRNVFDVRRALDDDRVILFAEQMEAGVEFPPIEISKVDDEWVFVDGRHRAGAAHLIGRETISAKVVPAKKGPEMLADAMRANWGGAKPPTRADIEHTIRRMLEAGAKNKDVYELLSFIPTSQVRNYVENALSGIRKVKLHEAQELVAEGISLETACHMTGVKLDALKDAIAGRKRKWGTGDSSIMAAQLQYFTRIYRSLITGIQKKLEHVMKLVEDSEMKPDSAMKIIEYWEEQANKQIFKIKDWKQRIQGVAPRKGRIDHD
jgi:hypothetical protein